MKKNEKCSVSTAAQKRSIFVIVASLLVALSLLLPFRAAAADPEDETQTCVIIAIDPSVASTEQSDVSEPTDEEDDRPTLPAQISELGDQPEATSTLDQTISIDSTLNPTETEHTEIISPENVEATSTITVETDVQQEAQSDASALVISNEYLFFSSDASDAAILCSQYGGDLLRWSDGIGVMQCSSLPHCGDFLFYPQEVYFVESEPYYEQKGESYTNTMLAQGMVSNPGTGVVIAVIDSGIDLDHPALADNIMQAVSVIPDSAYGSGGYFSTIYQGAQDYEGHGSHVAGILVGQTDDITIGIVPDAKIVSIKALEKYGTSAVGTTEWLIRAILYAISQDVDIINLSIGGSNSYVSAAQVVLQQAANAGILVICATGNTGAGLADAIDYPAAYDSTLAVSSVTIDGDNVSLSTFSKYGAGTDLSAPGDGIYSCDALGSYISLSGTSMSCAVVSGVAGLLLSQNPSMTPEEVICLLEQAATDVGDNGYDTKFGWGVVDAKESLLLLRHGSNTIETQPAPKPNIDTAPTPTIPRGSEVDAASDWLKTQQNQAETDASQQTAPSEQINTEELQRTSISTLILLLLVGGVIVIGMLLFLLLRYRKMHHSFTSELNMTDEK